MRAGEIIIASFSFTDLIGFKARPAVVITETPELIDLIVCMISSVVPHKLHPLHILLEPDKINNLKTQSIIKVYGIAKIETKMVISGIGQLSADKNIEFVQKFKSLIN